MSAPVDVLAAIASAVGGLHETGQNQYASDLLDARAAIAEALTDDAGTLTALLEVQRAVLGD